MIILALERLWVGSLDGTAIAVLCHRMSSLPHPIATARSISRRASLGAKYDPFVLNADPNAPNFRVPNISLTDTLTAHGLTTNVAQRLLRVGEKSGSLGDMSERVAAFHEEEISRWVDWLTKLIGPALMLVIGVVIGGIVVLMYLPIFQLAETIQ